MTIWFISDTHFGHDNLVTTFKRSDGSPARAFASAQEMDETMIARWNAVVRPSDHIYHLGDLTMARGNQTKYIDAIMARLSGHKRILLGNHDQLKSKWYQQHFEKVKGSQVFDNLLFTHIPVAPWCHGRFRANVHGHTHANGERVYWEMAHDATTGLFRDVAYVNLSVEQINYAPVSLEEIKSWIASPPLPKAPF